MIEHFNTATINFLQTCPTIKANPLYFNFGNVKNNAHQIITSSDDISLQKPFVDGSVAKRYTFSIDSYKSIAYNPIVPGDNENVSDLADVQAIVDWVNEQGDNMIFPDFGENCIIDSMQTLSTKPDLLGVDTTLTPAMAIYRITIQIDYIDESKKLWN